MSFSVFKMQFMNRREKMYALMIILIIGTFTFYYILNHLQNNIEDTPFGEQKCSADLKQARSQLSVISDYKNRLDKLLSDTKKAYDLDKTRFKDIMDSCIAMKQQCNFCRNQFEDLRSECKAVREQLDTALKELEQYKTTKSGG